MSAISNQLRDALAFNYAASTVSSSLVRGIALNGENLDINSGTVPETIWHPGGVYVFPTAATVVRINSTSDQDMLGTGTGAWVALIEGLDSNYNEQFESVSLNGSGIVTSTKLYYRVNSFRTVFHGTGQKNTGAITASVGSSVVRRILAGESLDQSAVFTVPRGHTYFPMSSTHSVLKSTTTICTIVTRVYVPETNGIYSSAFTTSAGAAASHNSAPVMAFPRVPEMCDYWFDISYASTTNVEVATLARGLLVKNSFIPIYLG